MHKIEKMVVSALSPLLKNNGFIWSKFSGMFIRRNPWGFHCLVWSCYETDSAGTLKLGLMIGVRHNDVDNLVNQLGLIYGENYKKYTTTVCRSLDFFPIEGIEGAHYIGRDSVQSDITYFVEKVVKLVEGAGDIFYQKYSTLIECSRGLNSPIDVTSHSLCNNFPRRAYYGLACALLAEPERVSDLAREYIEFATASEMVHLQKFTDRISLLLSLYPKKLN